MSKKARPSFLVGLMLCAPLLLTACISPKAVQTNASSGATDQPLVLTTFTVLADMARNVAGDRLRVESITKQGAEIHGYEPTPSDIRRASGADLILENGLGLELWSRRFTAAAGNVPTVTLTEGMKPLPIEEDAYAGKPNPHAWMSPKRAMQYVDRMVDAFSKLDPAGASTQSKWRSLQTTAAPARCRLTGVIGGHPAAAARSGELRRCLHLSGEGLRHG